MENPSLNKWIELGEKYKVFHDLCRLGAEYEKNKARLITMAKKYSDIDFNTLMRLKIITESLMAEYLRIIRESNALTEEEIKRIENDLVKTYEYLSKQKKDERKVGTALSDMKIFRSEGHIDILLAHYISEFDKFVYPRIYDILVQVDSRIQDNHAYIEFAKYAASKSGFYPMIERKEKDEKKEDDILGDFDDK